MVFGRVIYRQMHSVSVRLFAQSQLGNRRFRQKGEESPDSIGQGVG